MSGLIFDNKNHIGNSGYAYDPGGSGNMTSDGFNTFTWDGENRLSTVNGTGASYIYDAVDRRVQSTPVNGSVQYLFDLGGNVVEELNGSTLNRAEMYFGRMHLGTYASGNIYLSHTDLLGTDRVRALITAPSTASETCANLPFGDGQNCVGDDLSPVHFTGSQRDTEDGLDQTWFRKFSSLQGRWLSPDPYSGTMNVADPESMNRYIYSSDNPINFVDPLGLADCSWGCMGIWDWLWGGWGQSILRLCSGFSGGPGGEGFADCEDVRFNPPGHRNDFKAIAGTGGGGSSAKNRKLTPAQCKAAQTLLQREAKSGTTVAAWQSAIGFGDSTVEPFNSSTPGNAYVNTAVGAVKVDWFTDLRLTTLIPGPQAPAYVVGKVTWTGVRLATGAPITNHLPFQDPIETRTMALAVTGYGFRGLFTPQFMKENCGQ